MIFWNQDLGPIRQKRYLYKYVYLAIYLIYSFQYNMIASLNLKSANKTQNGKFYHRNEGKKLHMIHIVYRSPRITIFVVCDIYSWKYITSNV